LPQPYSPERRAVLPDSQGTRMHCSAPVSPFPGMQPGRAGADSFLERDLLVSRGFLVRHRLHLPRQRVDLILQNLSLRLELLVLLGQLRNALRVLAGRDESLGLLDQRTPTESQGSQVAVMNGSNLLHRV